MSLKIGKAKRINTLGHTKEKVTGNLECESIIENENENEKTYSYKNEIIEWLWKSHWMKNTQIIINSKEQTKGGKDFESKWERAWDGNQ